jgi:non-heme chloroperoxidase
VATRDDGGAKAHYDCIEAFSETDFTDDLKRIEVAVFLMHGEDDEIVPAADAALIGIKLLKRGTPKVYPGLPHGTATTHADIVKQDLLAFLRR